MLKPSTPLFLIQDVMAMRCKVYVVVVLWQNLLQVEVTSHDKNCFQVLPPGR